MYIIYIYIHTLYNTCNIYIYIYICPPFFEGKLTEKTTGSHWVFQAAHSSDRGGAGRLAAAIWGATGCGRPENVRGRGSISFILKKTYKTHIKIIHHVWKNIYHMYVYIWYISYYVYIYIICIYVIYIIIYIYTSYDIYFTYIYIHI